MRAKRGYGRSRGIRIYFSTISRISSDREENLPETEERKKKRLVFLPGQNIFRKIFQKHRRIVSMKSENLAKTAEIRTAKDKFLGIPRKIQEIR